MHRRGDESSVRKKMPQGVIRHNGRGRSRTGCLTCIERHIRCDERRPYCRNCAKAGRQCKRRDPATAQRSTSKVQIWTLDNRFGDSGVSYLSLRIPDISDVARRSAFEFERLVQKTPISQLCAETIAQSYSPRYYHLATLYPCVRYALVGAAGYGHFKATGTIDSQEIGIRYTTSAISHLQTEIDNFSQQNADAILTTATVFATAAQDWDTWIIYIEGVSTVVKRMKESGYASIFPLMFEKLFSFWHFPADILSDSNQKTVLADSFTAMRLQVTRIIGSIFALKNVIGIDQWSSAGFAEFEKLASIVHETLSLSSSTEMFWGFRLLRYWMLWFPVTVADRKDHLTQVLSAHFYLLLLSVARVFPERYAPSLERLCVKLIGEVLNNVEEEFRSDLSLRLVENTLASLLGGE